MTIEQTVEIQTNHRLVLDLPLELPVGRAKAAITLTFEERPTAEREAALVELFRCCANTGDTMDAYMERHWADNDFERALELRQEKEREQYQFPGDILFVWPSPWEGQKEK
jgi:hypothetical protein